MAAEGSTLGSARAGGCGAVVRPIRSGAHEKPDVSTEKSYPDIHTHSQKLTGQVQREIPSVMEGFGKLHHATAGDGTLDPKTRERIALGIAISVRCEGCISFHVHDALKAGATRPEIVEAIGVAILMGGGPSLTYGVEAYEALGQFEAEFGAAQRAGDKGETRAGAISAD